MLSFRTWQLGVKSLLLHPLRSVLTMLGIFIGVASVIWLLAIGEGISAKAQEQIAGLGAQNIIIRSKKPPHEVTANIRGPVPYGLTWRDFDRMVHTIPTIQSAIPIRELRRQFHFEDNLIDGRLVGCTTDYAEVTGLEVASGHFITTEEVRSKQSHCVLAAETAKTLFGEWKEAIGRSVHSDDDQDFYTVVGVLQPKQASAAVGGSLSAQDYSRDVYVPISTVRAQVGDFVVTRRSGSFEGEIVELNQITLKVRELDDVLPTYEIVQASLTNHDRLQDISIVVPLQLLEQAKTTRMMFIVFMGLIAAISLLVGGIGIMNIMLATVTERTREIGIRRALGAQRSDIVRQFLVETIVLSTAGGLLGVIGGLALLQLTEPARYVLERLRPEMMSNLPDAVKTVTPIVVPASIPIAFLIAVAVGILFGVYPARRAAMLDPIDALRRE